MKQHHQSDDLCNFLRERLELFLDGELSGSENLQFQTHLKECEECAEYWADDEAVAESLLVALAPDADSLTAQSKLLSSSVRQSNIAAPSKGRGYSLATLSLVAVAASILSMLTLVWVSGNLETPQENKTVEMAQCHQVGFVQGEVLARLEGENVWRQLHDGESLIGPVEIQTGPLAHLSLNLEGGRGSVLLYSESRLKFGDKANSETLNFNVTQGRLSARLAASPFLLSTEEFELRDLGAEDVEFLMIAERDLFGGEYLDNRISVMRGRLVAKSAKETKTLVGDDMYMLRDGALLVCDKNGETIEDAVLVDSPNRPTLQRFVHMRREYLRLRYESQRSLAYIKGLLEKDIDSNQRVSLVRLLALYDDTVALATLKTYCFDYDSRVQVEAIIGLESSNDPTVADHFLDVAYVASGRVKLQAALSAARTGREEGARILYESFRRSTDSSLRLEALRHIVDLVNERESARKFLQNLIDKPVPGTDAEVLKLAQAALKEVRGH